MAEPLTFEAPGPGSWGLDPVHFPRPVTRYWAAMHPDAFARGTHDFAEYYGMVIDGLQTQYVNGFAYNRMMPAPEEKIPARFARADEVFAKKVWREQLREWDEQVKPASIATHREIQSVAPDSLGADELIEYLHRCADHHAVMITQHMRFTASAVIPTGDFLAHVGTWVGVAPAELLGLMQGAAPVSAGSSDELKQLTSTIASDSAAAKLLQSDRDPAEVLAALRDLGGASGSAVSNYLDLVGYRPLDGFDISEPAALELPDALLRAMRVAVERRDDTSSNVDERIENVRRQVPEAHRDEYDELLGEARLMYRLRDERGIYSDSWASGLMRRAVLAGGRRLADQGRIQRAGPPRRRDPRRDGRAAGRIWRTVERRARRSCRVPRHAQRQGRTDGARRSAESPA